ncbi:DUF2927 domain-containing protein [Thiomicrorhabdus lithotrophica]|uniref:DUF2927 domain-containing protein n=1 Tax=Thiomicrorhabdus lithotrophica TaxID=2949997 RepID=A0ABY8CAS2_9GAMM|nr:DUF2927 domain-containing protein [Thiomicrorhabdus lithotrophica]WEJ63034.1 DUF2927 domain-containing protein [Thiomicrorhabdus lithotrophica]
MLNPNTISVIQSLKIVLGFSLLMWQLPTYATENQNLNWQNSNYIQKAFNEIALKNEYRKTAQRILKWQKPIRYAFHYHQMPKNTLVEELFDAHLKHLADITQLPISKSAQANNLTIHLTSDKHYGKVIKKFTHTSVKNIQRDSNCMGSFKTNSKNEIISAEIVLPVDHVFSRGLLVACIVEESTQVLGLPNDSDWVHPSIANDASKVELLTGLDYMLLKILYDPQLKAGMNRAKSQPIIRQLIEKFERAGIIEKAHIQVNQSGLFPFVN